MVNHESYAVDCYMFRLGARAGCSDVSLARRQTEEIPTSLYWYSGGDRSLSFCTICMIYVMLSGWALLVTVVAHMVDICHVTSA